MQQILNDLAKCFPLYSEQILGNWPLSYQRTQIQQSSPIYPKETESKTLLFELGWWQQMPPA